MNRLLDDIGMLLDLQLDRRVKSHKGAAFHFRTRYNG